MGRGHLLMSSRARRACSRRPPPKSWRSTRFTRIFAIRRGSSGIAGAPGATVSSDAWRFIPIRSPRSTALMRPPKRRSRMRARSSPRSRPIRGRRAGRRRQDGRPSASESGRAKFWRRFDRKFRGAPWGRSAYCASLLSLSAKKCSCFVLTYRLATSSSLRPEVERPSPYQIVGSDLMEEDFAGPLF